MASMSAGRKGNCELRSRLSARCPWNSPQSSKSVCPHASSRCIEQVTVGAAPDFCGLAMGRSFPSEPRVGRVDAASAIDGQANAGNEVIVEEMQHGQGDVLGPALALHKRPGDRLLAFDF